MRLCNFHSGKQSAQATASQLDSLCASVCLYFFISLARCIFCFAYSNPFTSAGFFKKKYIGKQNDHSPRASLSEADLEMCVLKIRIKTSMTGQIKTL